MTYFIGQKVSPKPNTLHNIPESADPLDITKIRGQNIIIKHDRLNDPMVAIPADKFMCTVGHSHNCKHLPLVLDMAVHQSHLLKAERNPLFSAANAHKAITQLLIDNPKVPVADQATDNV